MIRERYFRSALGRSMHTLGAGGDFSLDVVRGVFSRRVWPYMGEALRQAGVFITSSVLIVLALVFVLGLDSVAYLGSTRLLGCWLVLPFVYAIAIVVGITASYLAVVIQIGQVSAGGYLQLFWMFQTPLDFVFSLVKGMAMSTFVLLVGIYYGYHAGGGGPVGVGRATAKSMFANILGIHLIGLLGTQLFWGSNPRSPIGG